MRIDFLVSSHVSKFCSAGPPFGLILRSRVLRLNWISPQQTSFASGAAYQVTAEILLHQDQGVACFREIILLAITNNSDHETAHQHSVSLSAVLSLQDAVFRAECPYAETRRFDETISRFQLAVWPNSRDCHHQLKALITASASISDGFNKRKLS